MDEYSPTLHYIEGPRNVIADTFSRLSRQYDTSGLVGKEAIVSDSAYYSFSDDKSVCDCFLNLPCFSSNKIKRNWKHKNKKNIKMEANYHCLICVVIIGNLMQTNEK